MTNLSSKAQKIVDASLLVSSSSPPPMRHRECIAAVLRALVEQGTFADVAVNKTVEVVLVDDILKIVEELEQI